MKFAGKIAQCAAKQHYRYSVNCWMPRRTVGVRTRTAGETVHRSKSAVDRNPLALSGGDNAD